MTDLERTIAAVATADVQGFTGLPPGLVLADLGGLLAFDPSDRHPGEAGNPRAGRDWVPAATTTYTGGLRLWLDEVDRVVLVEGVHPVDGDGEPLRAPDLGEPAAVFDAVLGPFPVPQAERVYAEQGLAVQVYAETGVLVGVLAFAPTTTEDYHARLQPHREPTRPFPKRVQG